MTRPGGGRRTVGLAALLALAALAGATGRAPADPGPMPAATAAPGDERQVTVFGIVADPNGKTIDPKLAQISGQLQRLRPGHGFALWGVKSARVAPGATLTCPLRDGQAVAVRHEGMTDAGKVRLGVSLLQDGRSTFATTVITPPNQLFFCERPLPDDARLLIGIGAR